MRENTRLTVHDGVTSKNQPKIKAPLKKGLIGRCPVIISVKQLGQQEGNQT